MFERLIKIVRQEDVTLFIGAGFSLEAHAPSVSALKEAILNEMSAESRKAHENDGLDKLSEYYVEEECCGSRNSLVHMLKGMFEFTPVSLDDHMALAHIPHFHHIFTTNYDTLLEDSYPEYDRQVIRTDKDCALIDSKKPVTIFKIHGDFTDPDSLLITSKDYSDFFMHRRNPEMWKLVETEFLTKNIVFIGYSLEDENILDIIHNVSEAIGKEQKEMFLIAPGINEEKQERLKEMHVHYFNALACDFLNELNNALLNNITEDFEKHRISAETYSRFCHMHNIEPIVSTKERNDNEVNALKSIDGKPLHTVFQVNTDKRTKQMLEERDFEENGILISNSPFPNVPCMRIANSSIREVVNGVTVNRNFKELLVSPAVKESTLTFIIPSRNFIESVKTRSYKIKKGKLVTEFDGESYHAKFDITVEKRGDNLYNILLNVNFESKKQYFDNNKALWMINIPDAIFSKEDVIIPEISSKSINAENNNKNVIEHNFDNIREYMENISAIEIASHKKFKVYKECTKESYENSIIIRSFLENRNLHFPTPRGLVFSMKVKEDSDFAKDWDNNKRKSVVLTDTDLSLTLNDRRFNIPFIHDIFTSCAVVNLHKDKSPYIADLKNDPDCYYRIYSDKSASEIFPNYLTL